MGVLSIRKLEGTALMGIWKITEDVGELILQLDLSETEQKLFGTFRTETRQKQWLAYRLLIRELISPQSYPVHYDESGKPFLAGSDWHISVTHTEEFAGVIISSESKVGIDMEKVRSRIDRVKEKFLSEDELLSIPEQERLEFLTLAWCAKEAVYKLHGLRNLDFRENIRISLPPGLDESIFFSEVVLPHEVYRYKLFHERTGDLFLVWALESGRR